MIDTTAVREKVLRLAMLGKLTEQLPEDGNAKELFDSIQLKMSLLLKEKKIKKIVCKGSMEECNFIVPDNWIVCTLSEISYSVGNKNNQIQTIDISIKGKYPVISQGLQYIDGYTDSEEKVITDVPVVLFGDHTRNVKYIDMPFVIGADGTKILKSLGIDSEFFYYAIANMANRIATRGYSRHFAQLAKKWFFLPPKSEQVRIVNRIKEVFETLDKIDEFQTQYASDIETLKSKLIDAGIQGKLTQQLPQDGTAQELYSTIQEEKSRLIKEKKIKKEKLIGDITENEIPFEIPDNWIWVHFGDIYSLTNGVASRGSEGGVMRPVLRLADLSNGDVTIDSIREIELTDKEFESHIVHKGDLIIIRVNGSRDKVATVFLYSEDVDISYCDHLFCGHRYTDYVHAKYISFVYKAGYIRRLIEPEIKTTAGQNSISQTSMSKLIIPLPPYAEQVRIVEKLESIFELI